MISRLGSLAIGLVLVASFGWTSSASAQCSADQTCQYNACRSPAFGTPSVLWGELKPVDTGQLPAQRDNTDFNEFADPDDENHPHWMSVDIENGWIFAAITRGLQIWDGRTTPASPVRIKVLGRSAFLHWVSDPHVSDPVRDVDAADGDDSALAVSLAGDGGLSVFRTTDKQNPVARYSDVGKEIPEVYAGRINNTSYAFAATKTTGLLAYNLTAAGNLGSACTEETPSNSCGVYLSRLGTRSGFSHVDGAGSADGTQHWVVASSGFFARGIEIWKVSNPASPQLALSALTTDFVHGVALWRNGSNYYLGLRITVGSGTQGRIYNVSCLASNNCTGLGSPVWSATLNGTGGDFFVTYSKANARDFLYFGTDDRCSTGLQNEWLYDVTTPTSARDVTPPAGLVGGQNTGYWGYQYRRTPTGFNFVNPRVGKFAGKYFYRSAYTIFDIHELTSGGPPTASFTYAPTTVYAGQGVNFTDTSLGVPTQWSWTFQGGSPGSSTAHNPSGVTFASVGNHLVSLTATNANGSDSTSQTLNVLDPAAQVGSVSASPNPALVCQGVSFQAVGVTGQAPLTLSWQVRNASNQLVGSGGDVNPFVWDTAAAGPGLYTATVTVQNGSGSDSAASPAVTVNALPALAFTSPGNAPETLNGPPFDSGLVNFRIQSVGATEWRWDFGDGTPPVWTTDPVSGPLPTHTYADPGDYIVTVEIRNCQQGAITSNSTLVSIPNTTPLVPSFAVQGLFCTAFGCFAEVNQELTFQDSSSGTPDFWDYDWDGNGTWDEENNTSAVTTHTYLSTGSFQPRLRVRRGALEAVHQHGPIIIGSGPSVTVTGPVEGAVGSELVFTATANNCSPGPSSWIWDAGTGATYVGSTTASSVTVVYTTPGSRVVEATAANGGCSGTLGSTGVTVTATPDFLFADGFESGDTSGWALTEPPL